MKSVIATAATCTILVLILADRTVGRSIHAAEKEKQSFFLDCYSISNPETDFKALVHVLNSSFHRNAMYKANLEMLTYLLAKLTTKQLDQLHLFLHNFEDDEYRKTAILKDFFGENASNFIFYWNIYTEWLSDSLVDYSAKMRMVGCDNKKDFCDICIFNSGTKLCRETSCEPC